MRILFLGIFQEKCLVANFYS